MIGNTAMKELKEDFIFCAVSFAKILSFENFREKLFEPLTIFA